MTPRPSRSSLMAGSTSGCSILSTWTRLEPSFCINYAWSRMIKSKFKKIFDFDIQVRKEFSNFTVLTEINTLQSNDLSFIHKHSWYNHWKTVFRKIEIMQHNCYNIDVLFFLLYDGVEMLYKINLILWHYILPTHYAKYKATEMLYDNN